MQINYGIFYSGCASTPNTVGLINWTTDEKIHEISVKGETGREIRAHYEKIVALLKRKYENILS